MDQNNLIDGEVDNLCRAVNNAFLPKEAQDHVSLSGVLSALFLAFMVVCIFLDINVSNLACFAVRSFLFFIFYGLWFSFSEWK